MKILIASRFVYPNIGGVSTYISQLKEGLERKGHSVDILARSSISRFYLNDIDNWIDSTKFQQRLKLKIRENIKNLENIDPYFKQAEIDQQIFGDIALSFGLSRYDLIHAQDIYAASALFTKKPKNIPLVGTMHGTPLYNRVLDGEITTDSEAWKFSLDYDRNAILSSDLCLVPSEWMKNFLIQTFNIPSDKIATSPHGMDIVQFQKKMNQENSQLNFDLATKQIIACPARLTAVKGHKYLLGALAKLKQDRNDWICWLIGNGPLEKQLKKQVEELELTKNVLFLGYQDNVPLLLKHSDIFVLSSLQENHPYAIMEAQVAGKPTVTTAVGGIPEMVLDGQTGLLSPRCNSEELYINLKTLLEKKELRETLGENGKKIAMKRWSIDTMIENTLLVYGSVLKSQY